MPPLRGARRAPWILTAARVALVSVVTVTAVAPAHAAESSWERPVPGAVLRPYREPVARYASGHRGVDFEAAPGTPVSVANDGRVTFAGSVAGGLHVVVAHEGGIRTSYSFLARIDVRPGATVSSGEVIGATGGSSAEHGTNALHFGARIGDRYIDPMLLFGPTDLTELVRLVPADERSAADRASPEDEARSLEDLFRDPPDGDCFGGIPFVEQVCDAAVAVAGWTRERLHEALDLGLDLVRQAGQAAEALADQLEHSLHALLDRLPDLITKAAVFLLRQYPLGRVLLITLTIGKLLYEHYSQDCDDSAPPANGRGGSGNWVMAVGGIDSARKRTRRRDADGNRIVTPSFGFEWERLGYEPDDLEWYSYRDESEVYSKDDTYDRVLRDAALLAEQLREKALAHPGRAVDLVGHSLGGRVIRAFLEYYWKDHEHEYPPLGFVVFFASPQNGTAAADVAQQLGSGPVYPVLAALDRIDAPGPALTSPVLADLAEGSEQSRYFATHPIPREVKALSIAASLDPLVNGKSGRISGGQNFVTNVGAWHPFDDHSGILHDDEALAAMRAFIEGRKLPCTGLADAAVSAIGGAGLRAITGVLQDAARYSSPFS